MNIFNFKNDMGWNRVEILRYLYEHSIKCIRCDVWDSNLLILYGCVEKPSRLARIFQIHEEVIYNTLDPLVIINLYQEKVLRGVKK